jgi:hypothetical protein
MVLDRLHQLARDADKLHGLGLRYLTVPQPEYQLTDKVAADLKSLVVDRAVHIPKAGAGQSEPELAVLIEHHHRQGFGVGNLLGLEGRPAKKLTLTAQSAGQTQS